MTAMVATIIYQSGDILAHPFLLCTRQREKKNLDSDRGRGGEPESELDFLR